MARERTNTVESEAPAARRAGGLELARSAARLGDQLPAGARLLLSLQQSAGNRAVRGLVQRLRSAEAGLQGRFAAVQREGLEEEEPLQGRFAPVQFQGLEDEELQLQAAQSAPAQRQPEPLPRRNESGLPDGLKSGVESLSGISLDGVEVHYNSAEPARLNALAYAQGTDIHVGPGQEQHLPHEAWHVVQQAQGRVKPTMQLQDGVPVNTEQALEHEADAMGAKVEDGSIAVQRTPVLGAPAVVQRTLGVRNPIVGADVATVKRFDPRKLVYGLTGHSGDKVVVKFEMPSSGEKVEQLGARRKALYDLARAALENVPEATVLSPPELNVLQQLDPATVTGDTKDLVSALQGGLAKGAVNLKMENADVGDSLKAMISKGTVTASLLTPKVLRQFGKMAFFDLLVSNTDRFKLDGDVNEENLDFTTGGTEALPLDNLDPFGGGIPSSLADFKAKARIATKDARKDYAKNALLNICAKAKQNVSNKQLPALIQLFADGMEDAARTCKAQEKRLEEVAFPKQGVTKTLHRPEQKQVAEGLANRLRAISV